LHSALFFTEGESLFKIPNHLVTEMEVSREGQIFFMVPKPAQDLEVFDTVFPVRLDFFKKGKAFCIKVYGTAHLVIDTVEKGYLAAASNNLQEQLNSQQGILIKVMVEYVDYIETISTMPAWVKKLKWLWQSLFFSHAGIQMSHAVQRIK